MNRVAVKPAFYRNRERGGADRTGRVDAEWPPARVRQYASGTNLSGTFGSSPFDTLRCFGSGSASDGSFL